MYNIHCTLYIALLSSWAAHFSVFFSARYQIYIHIYPQSMNSTFPSSHTSTTTTIAHQVLNYGEFCMEPLSDLSMGRFAVNNQMIGFWLVRIAWNSTKTGIWTAKFKEQVKTCKTSEPRTRFKFYYIVLSMSIICLAATIFIYLLFRSALLQVATCLPTCLRGTFLPSPSTTRSWSTSPYPFFLDFSP